MGIGCGGGGGKSRQEARAKLRLRERIVAATKLARCPSLAAGRTGTGQTQGASAKGSPPIR